MTSCSARVCTYAKAFGHSDWETGTVAYQCDKPVDKRSLCTACAGKGTPFGIFGKAVPDYAQCDGKMRDEDGYVSDAVKEGEALCWVVAEPDMDDDGNLIVEKQELLDDDYWMCDEDWDGDEDEDTDTDTDTDTSKKLSIADLRALCDDAGVDHAHMRKCEMRAALTDADTPTPKAASKVKSPKAAAKVKSPKADKPKRKPSAYNNYMSNNLAAYKKTHPSLSHIEAFTDVAKLWKTSDDNPKTSA